MINLTQHVLAMPCRVYRLLYTYFGQLAYFLSTYPSLKTAIYIYVTTISTFGNKSRSMPPHYCDRRELNNRAQIQKGSFNFISEVLSGKYKT